MRRESTRKEREKIGIKWLLFIYENVDWRVDFVCREIREGEKLN
jgi:hypothetical protein